VACWRHCVAGNPSDPRPLRNLGRAFYDRGKFDEARGYYEQALALDPAHAETRLFVEALNGSRAAARVPAKHVGTLYDGLASTFDDDPRCRSPELLKAALEPAPAPRSLAILDLGCGTGLCGVQFRNWASKLTGVDLSANMLARARARGIYDELIQGDLLATLQAAPASFDLVLASDSLIFIGDLDPLTQAVQQALRPGGRFAFTTELLDGTGYQIVPAIHFAHSRPYLQSLATAHRMHEISMTEMIFRKEMGVAIPGLVVVWARA
jgi:predicted TPR repeat methyltransferase